MAGKWVEPVTLEAPADQVAGIILHQRVQIVLDLLPLAAHHYREDVEHVHRLRVGCRRASAALRAFRPLLPHKPKSLLKWLRRIRRAAGPARDADVLLSRLKNSIPPGAEADYVTARLKQHRKAGQKALIGVEARVQSGKLLSTIQECATTLEDKPSGARVYFGQFAVTALWSASCGVFKNAGIKQPTLPQLHRLRIAGKRLRYSIEIFHTAFPKELREDIYPLVESIQTRLGKLNDHASAQALFQQWLKNIPADDRTALLARLVAEEHEAALQIREEFLRWWNPNRIAQLGSQLATLIGKG